MLELMTPRVWKDITSAAKASKKPSFAAVAYFGASGDSLLPLRAGSALVVDATINTVAAGATCPHSLLRLHKSGVEIFSAKHLHAKIYAFDTSAFVGSANASQRSNQHLIEAVVRFDNPKSVESVRQSVLALCRTRLDSDDIRSLLTVYRPPKPELAEKPKQTLLQTLLMELTLEQGRGRESQVQPPRPVWENYFGLDWDAAALPSLTLLDEDDPIGAPMKRDIVRHDHNLTLEISGARPPRPAILQMRKAGRNSYRYKVIRPHHTDFAQVRQLLRDAPNPRWTSGRSWIVI